ncbi:MAG: hypothetical protein EBS04_05220 [Chitinophagia bacterium]|nr:hypothetical protein [Chitinophagia bacterium]
MKKLNILFIAVISITSFSCNKETATTQKDVMKNLLVNKNWFLDYTLTEGMTSTTPVVLKSYVGQSTYFVTYLKDGTTKDSDGLTGTYTVEIIHNKSQIHSKLKTFNGNPLEIIYNIISVGDTKLVLSKVDSSSNPTQLFFTNK